jgi:hypothetical protein
MTDEINNPAPKEAPEDYDALLWEFLNRASPQWAVVELGPDTATRSNAFVRLVLSGQVELRLRVLARGASPDPRVQATCIVTGDYKSPLADSLCVAVPEFGGRVTVRPETAEYRLSAAGLKTQLEMREFGGGKIEESFLSSSLEFVIPGVVNITDLEYLPAMVAPVVATPPVAQPAEAPGANQGTGGKVKKKECAWPVPKTEAHVAPYLSARKAKYLRLARDVLDERSGAATEFRNEFGSTAIAREITANVGIKYHRACRKQDVLKTETYRTIIQPLLRNPPEKPKGWDRMIEEREGEELPAILEDLEFEDEEDEG